ncbi:hypothetical protein FG167_16360 [Lacinutrix sp. WUR7]|uniref:hypothetical protein n=1 Tax=Lacinutrix sp. WUR7 TaxID=2653681 RepID=UPI00193E65EA|nr:hypothetical protein [Lacinutrix sp. WUR7]QRM90744.1 hypothetical protein FG167_16360 [Lacinutrix sp. WUR7]
MNKSILLLIFIVFTSFVKAQDVVFTISNKEFIPCEITLNDGKILNGYVKDFSLPKTLEFRSFGYEFTSIESKLKLD